MADGYKPGEQGIERMSDVSAWLWHPDTDQMIWSEPLHQLLGTNAAALPAPRLSDFLDCVAPADRERVHAALRGIEGQRVPLRVSATATGKGATAVQIEIGAGATAAGILGWIRIAHAGPASPAVAAPPAVAAGARHDESLGVLAGGIAHDFNNLLVSIMGNLDLARYSDALPRDTALHLSAAMQAAERAAELCRQLLAFSGRGPSRFETVDVNPRIRRIAGLLIGSLPRHTTLDLQLADEPLPVNIDPGQFTQLLINLLTNAAEATHGDEARIRLRTQWRDGLAASADELFIAGAATPGNCVAIVIEDDGDGMNPALQARLCEPFFSTKGIGRGLGLAAAQGIVRNHGGALALRSTPGAGTRVTVLLPPSGIAYRSSLAPVMARPTRTVLVVDDEAAVRDVMRLQLEKLGYHTRAVANGRECIEHVLAHGAEIDAVMLDQTMPIMGGTEAYQRLREIAPMLPIVLMTGFTHDNIADLIGTDSRASFLPKPYALNRLERALRELMGE